MNPVLSTTRNRHEVVHNYQPDAGPDALPAKVADLLAALPSGKLSTEQLPALDQFHARGLAATKELAVLLGPIRGSKVLDAGSGLGGPARFLAETYGCQVVGVDLTPAFVAVAETLTERTGLQDKVRFQIGDLTELPFADAEFDAVWTQHVVMNISERGALYREIRRVLKPGGKFAFYDVLATDDKPPLIFPVPWAKTPATSYLLNKAETLAAFEAAGLPCTTWKDVSAEAQSAFEQSPPALPPLSLAALYGPEVRQWVGNFARNLREGRAAVAMGVCEATGKGSV